jgi:hypothetical protein
MVSGALRVILSLLVVALVVALLALRAAGRMRFLAQCRAATWTALERTEYTSVRNTNVPMRTARGWTVSRESYTGSTVISHVRWQGVDGETGTLTIRGTPYEDGVVLYHGDRALCVVSLACAPHPDSRGQWDPQLSAGIWTRVFVLALSIAGYAWWLIENVG